MQFRDENLRFAEQFDIEQSVFSTSVITVELRAKSAKHEGHIAAFLLAVNLLSRTFERVHAVFPAGTEAHSHPWHLTTVKAVVNELKNTVGGSLRIGPPKHSNVVLSIGAPPSLSADREVMVEGSDWLAALDCNLPKAGNGVLGSLYAATVGASQVLLHTLHLANAPYEPMGAHRFSLLDLLPSDSDRDTPKPIWIPETHLVGVGAIGSAAIYALAHLKGVGGLLHLIDNETVDEPNLNRYILMRRRDINRSKVEAATEALRTTSIDVKPFPTAFATFLKDQEPLVNLLLTPVDSEEGRRRLAKTLPRRVINAATGGTTVTLSTHGFADGKACLHCLYLPKANEATAEEIMARDMGLPIGTVEKLIEANTPMDERLIAQIERHRGAEQGTWADYEGSAIHSFYAKAVCGDAEIRLPTANVIAPLSFVSAAAGILLAAELVKTRHPELRRHALDNYFRVDTLKQPNPAFRRTRPQDPSGRCICQDPDYIAVYNDKYPSQ